MSKKVKSLIEKELAGKLGGIDGLAVIDPRGMDGIKTNQLRRKLRDKGMRMHVVKNTLARRAGAKTKVAGFEALLDGPSAVIFGQASIAAIARLLIEAKKADEKLQIRGIFFDGEVFLGDKGIEKASKLPTREEAIASLLAALLGPGRKLAGAIKGPGANLGALLKAIEAKKEKEPAEPAAAAPAPAADAAPAAPATPA